MRILCVLLIALLTSFNSATDGNRSEINGSENIAISDATKCLCAALAFETLGAVEHLTHQELTHHTAWELMDEFYSECLTNHP